MFHWTKLPLTTWFLAIYHLSQSKGGMSSVELARRLGTRQPTAWLLKHKLMAAMQAREAEKPKLAGPGRDRRRLSRRPALGRQARPGGRRQDPVRGRGRDDGRAQAQAAAADGGQGLPQEGDRDAGQARPRRRQQRRHRWPVLLDGGQRGRLRPLPDGDRLAGRKAARWVPFTWVNTALGNIKTALAGTYHHVSAKHAQRYLTSFAWRFNRRYQLDTLTERLAYACARTRAASLPGHHRRMSKRDNQEMEWVAEFLASHPQVRIEFVLSDATVDLIEEGIDVAFRGNATRRPNYVVRKIQTRSIGLVASPSYLAARGTPATLQDLPVMTVCLCHRPGTMRPGAFKVPTAPRRR